MEKSPSPLTLTGFRANLYSLVDQMLATGEPLFIERHGRVVKVAEAAVKKRAKNTPKRRDLSKIKRRKCMTMPPNWYISPKLFEWSGEIDPNIR